MNKIYDKLLLAIAALALLAGIGIFFTTSGGAPTGGSVAVNISDNPYEAIPIPESGGEEAAWPFPEPQSTGWTYDVFTPPKIFLDANGAFTIVPFDDTPPEPPAPFGIYLSEIKRNPYRIQLVGFIEEDLSDASKSLLLFVDEETQDNVRGRIGRDLEKYEFAVEDFTVEKVTFDDGMMSKVAKATIYDKRTGESVILTNGKRLFKEGVTVVLRSSEDASVNLEFEEAPVEFETSLGQYVLEEISLEDSTVTVTKLAVEEEDEAETLTLSPREDNVSESEPVRNTETITPSAEGDRSPFDGLF